jgi:hypothetical protein
MAYARRPKYTQDDFTETQWEWIITARWRARTRKDMRDWYRVLRTLCGYRTGSPVRREMEQLVDQWLHDHPSWRRYRMYETK